MLKSYFDWTQFKRLKQMENFVNELKIDKFLCSIKYVLKSLLDLKL